MLLNDVSIRALAEQGMIDPFVPEMVREYCSSGQSGFWRKSISYGLGSYGYDLRLSPNEFRIFRHIPGEIVNPKRFNPECLETAKLHSDDDGDFFIIPANSYALGVAVERLCVPDDITVVCLGKSTLARCFSAGTKVKLVDGDYTFTQLIQRASDGDDLYGYGVKDGKIVIQELENPRYIEDSNLVRVTLDNGKWIDCTPDHKFMLRNGEWCEAQHLMAGTSLRPIYEHYSHGYPTIYDPVKANELPTNRRCDAWFTVHRAVWKYLENKGAVKVLPEGWHVHHDDGNIFNCHPSNLAAISPSEHAKIHNQTDGRHLTGGEAFKSLYEKDVEFREKINGSLHCEESKKKADENARWWKQSKGNALHLEKARTQRWSQPDSRVRQSEVAKNGVGKFKRRADVTDESIKEALLKAGTIRGAARLLNVDRSAFRRFPEILNEFKQGTLQYNHKVVSVTPLDGLHQTYCLTAPETGNFALSTGVFVSNCGIIANVTPAEASWAGYLTLEFSNASNADCRMYANEGVVQLLFMQGQPCQTTYQGRNGKYQDQPQHIVLPIA
jgi:deoxycytidine triphosphate deaminase